MYFLRTTGYSGVNVSTQQRAICTANVYFYAHVRTGKRTADCCCCCCTTMILSASAGWQVQAASSLRKIAVVCATNTTCAEHPRWKVQGPRHSSKRWLVIWWHYYHCYYLHVYTYRAPRVLLLRVLSAERAKWNRKKRRQQYRSGTNS